MITRLVRIGRVSDQDTVRRHDTLAMTPSERVMQLIRLRDRQFGASSRPVRGSGAVSYRNMFGLPRP
jgi:hypothetical protein